MAMFIHFAPQSCIKSILRNGIARIRRSWNGQPGGMYATPVTPNFYITHQWQRELRRVGGEIHTAVYFRIPDEELVWFGRYGQEHRQITAAEALSAMMKDQEVHGYEVIIPRKIRAGEIHRVKQLPQTIGWRYFPYSHKKKPCGCSYCQRSLYGARKLRKAYEVSGG